MRKQKEEKHNIPAAEAGGAQAMCGRAVQATKNSCKPWVRAAQDGGWGMGPPCARSVVVESRAAVAKALALAVTLAGGCQGAASTGEQVLNRWPEAAGEVEAMLKWMEWRPAGAAAAACLHGERGRRGAARRWRSGESGSRAFFLFFFWAGDGSRAGCGGTNVARRRSGTEYGRERAAAEADFVAEIEGVFLLI